MSVLYRKSRLVNYTNTMVNLTTGFLNNHLKMLSQKP